MPTSSLTKPTIKTNISKKKSTPTDLISDTIYALSETKSITEMEKVILTNCKKNIELISVAIKLKKYKDDLNSKISLAPSVRPHIQESTPQNYIATIDLLNKKVQFIFSKKVSFKAQERKFLDKLMNQCKPFLNHLSRIEQYQILQNQWKLTFDSITTPLCITDSNLRVIKTNKAFQIACENKKSMKIKGSEKIEEDAKKTTHLIGTDAFKSLFGKSYKLTLESETLKGSNRKVKKETLKKNDYQISFKRPIRILQKSTKETFLVTLEKIGMQIKKEFYLMQSENITQKLKIENQILKSTKRAELGILSSNIAHELNNPLGGIISFLQLIKMDLKKDAYEYNDILALEESAHKCKDIIQRLLDFSRKSSDNLDSQESIDLQQIQKKLLPKGSNLDEV